MKTIPSSVTRTGAIASGQLKRVYQGRSTTASLRRGEAAPCHPEPVILSLSKGEGPAYVAGAAAPPDRFLRRLRLGRGGVAAGSGSRTGGDGGAGGGDGRERIERIGMVASLATCLS